MHGGTLPILIVTVPFLNLNAPFFRTSGMSPLSIVRFENGEINDVVQTLSEIEMPTLSSEDCCAVQHSLLMKVICLITTRIFLRIIVCSS
jgi:hypothetical protein